MGGYVLLNTTEYVVNWTMPHCVLCLRLIGLAFDVADGRHYESLKEEQRETALRERPSALQTFSYAFFFGGSLVGPQFPCKRYLDFINGSLIPAQLSAYTPNWYAFLECRVFCPTTKLQTLLYCLKHRVCFPMFACLVSLIFSQLNLPELCLRKVGFSFSSAKYF